jgi:uncharacterized membrane protein (UPF0127 family)
MKVNFKGKEVEIPDVRECKGLAMGIGLMFSRREKAKALVFEFDKPTRMAIHSFFVFFPFLAVWLDEENNVLEIKRVKSFIPRIYPRKSYSKLVEIPLNECYDDKVKILVGDRKI